MDTFRLVLKVSAGGKLRPIGFRLAKNGPVCLLCIQGSFGGKGPIAFFGLQIRRQPLLCVCLDQLVATKLAQGFTLKVVNSRELWFKVKGVSIPAAFQAYLVSSVPD